MPTPSNPLENQTTYVINAEDAAETERLLLADRIATKAMGGLFPPDYTPSSGHMVLDLACGPGGWVLDVARAYPETDVLGIDISQKMIRYARAQAQVLGRHHAYFQEMDILKPLAFPDDAFEFVNARYISGLMRQEDWSRLLQECVRVAQPGGIIRITENELWSTTSHACEQLAMWVIHAMQASGRTFDPSGRMTNYTIVLPSFMRATGLTTIQHQPYFSEFSYGTDAYEALYPMVVVASYQLVRPFLLRMGITTEEVFAQTLEQASIEMRDPAFKGAVYTLSVWGRKPFEEGSVVQAPEEAEQEGDE